MANLAAPLPTAAGLFANTTLPELLPVVRGRLEVNFPLAAQTWFRVGGHAEVFFRPADADDLAYFLANTPSHVPVTIIGLASNILVRDGGVPGVVIKLGPNFASIQEQGGALLAGAGAVDLNVARAAQAAGLGGLEFLSGIPGTIGGGLRMNAGAYGREFKDVVIVVTALDRTGQQHTITNAQCGFAYRHSNIAADWILLTALLQGEPGDPAQIANTMREIQASRAASQPIREKTGGSTFANPIAAEHEGQPRKAWQLIDAAGCRGLKIGHAQMSEKHCNFMINTGQATAAQLENLGELVRQRVREHSGVELRWEIKRIGLTLAEAEDFGAKN